MKEIKTTTYKGTRILLGNEKRQLINKMTNLLVSQGYTEISLPIINFRSTFPEEEIGKENLSLMFEFKDRKSRDLCLAPEYTAIMMKLAKTDFLGQKDVKLFYVQECFRGEKPQAGRYRQFTQLGVEILNPTQDYNFVLSELACDLILDCIGLDNFDVSRFDVDLKTKRGLGYYKDGQGFEISCPELRAQKQVCGGGEYDGGVGFAIGIDRLLLLNK